jgi:ATP-dependent helicase HrpB
VNQVIGWYYRDLCLRIARDASAPAEKISACLAGALRDEAMALITADEETAAWLQRLTWLRSVRPDLALPDFSAADATELIESLCAGCRARAEVAAKPKLPWLQGRLTHEQNRALDSEAPARITVPSGSSLRLDYSQAERPPILAVRLQELFGLAETPRIAGGRVPLLLHLLGPNYRPEQITQDLASFWKNTYPQVRKDLRARYPKHSWPENPLTAPPQAKGKHRPPH